MPYPFVVGESLGAAELNAALDMRMMASGVGLAFPTGGVLFGATTGGFQTDSANLFWDDTNNRLGVNANAPQAMFQVGKGGAGGPASARAYNAYTDTANGEWSYLGDWLKTSGVATYGSDKNGSGIIRDVSFVRGGVEQLRLTANGVTLSASSVTQSPAVPVLLGTGTLAAASRGVAVMGNFAYTTNQGVTPTHNLEIWDITVPTLPFKVGGLDLPAGALGSPVVAGHILYTALNSATFGLQIVDISNPKAPVLIRSQSTGIVNTVALSGGYLYAGLNTTGSLRIYDITDPAVPILKSTIVMPGLAQCHALAFQGKYAYCIGPQTVAGTGGLSIVDISDVVNLSVVFNYNTVGNARGVAVSGRYAYVVGGAAASGLEVVDISDPANPQLVKVFATIGNGANYINPIIAGNYLYVTTTANIQIINISDPANPSSVGSVATVTSGGVVLSGNRLYVNGNGQLRIYDTFGIDTVSAKVGSLNTDQLFVEGSSYFAGDMYAQRGLVVGQAGIFSRGPLMCDTSDALVPISAIFGTGLVCIGGNSNAFPALKRSAAILQVRLGDDSALAALECASLGATLAAGNTAIASFAYTTATAYTSVSFSTGARIHIVNTDNAAETTQSSRLMFSMTNSAAANAVGAAIGAVFTSHTASAESASIVFQTQQAGVTGERGRIVANNWGIGGNFVGRDPQANLHIGSTVPATARAYNVFTDAANGDWSYLGDWSTSIARYGTDKNGSGVARAVNILAGGVNAITIDASANVSVQKFLGLNATVPISPLALGGIFTTTLGVLATIDTTIVSSFTSFQFGVVVQPTFQPSGASLSIASGMALQPKLTGSVAISDGNSLFITAPDLTSYAGANPISLEGIVINAPVGGSATKYTTAFYSLLINASTNGNGVTAAPTVFNIGINLAGSTASPGAGGNMNNRTINLTVPSGSGVGTTNNYGLVVTGNGGASGTTTNYAIYSDSTALSILQSLRVGAAGSSVNPTNATAPFLYITASAGVPTGIPRDATAGSIAISWDSTAKKLMVYDQPTATWKGVVLA